MKHIRLICALLFALAAAPAWAVPEADAPELILASTNPKGDLTPLFPTMNRDQMMKLLIIMHAMAK